MKKVLFIITFLILGVMINSSDAYAEDIEACFGADGTFTAQNWPAGAEAVTVSCPGDTGRAGCVGSSTKISPNQPYHFGNCSCWDYGLGEGGTKCVTVSNIPEGCHLENEQFACASNHAGILPGDFKIVCPEEQATGTPATPTSGPACNTPCTGPRDCEGAKDNCTTCVDNGTTKTCQIAQTPTPSVSSAPTPTTGPGTPTPTSGPACNTPCTGPRDCEGAKDGCTTCVDNGTTKTCQVVLTPTPKVTSTPTPTKVPGTPTPTQVPACNTPCTGPRDCEGAKDGCTTCVDNGTTKTCQVSSTPTPTLPPFSKDMCKCDGASITPIVIGSPATFTAFGKVEGTPAIGIAQIKNMNVSVYKEGVGTFDLNRIIGPITVNATQVEKTATKARYKIEWPFVDTAKLEKNTTYRIAADVRAGCVRQQTALLETPQQVVLAATATASQPNFFDVIRQYISGFFSGLFGNQSTPTPQSTPRPTTPSPTRTQGSDQNLQLKPIYPATILRQSCDIVYFRTGE